MITSVEAAVSPSNKMSFLLDWELTMKCNLDCSYCSTDIYGGHNNSIEHPPVDECLRTLDFMYNYVDIYMQHKPKHSKHVILNVYGGESLFHPNIVELLKAARDKHKKYETNWSLTITTTTNAIVGKRQLSKIVEYVDEFTVSYHAENLPKQKQQFKNNILFIKNKEKRIKCVVLMHPKYFQDNLDIIEFCNKNEINHLPRQLDHSKNSMFDYDNSQVIWFDKLYAKKSRANELLKLPENSCGTNLSQVGRSCCGGRSLVQNQNFSQRTFYIENIFTDWYCSVNWFFLYVKQVTGEVFVNKDCKMNFNRTNGPIGLLAESQSILNDLKEKLESGSLPTIQCSNYRCFCGLCAPKAKDIDTYSKIMQKYKLIKSQDKE